MSDVLNGFSPCVTADDKNQKTASGFAADSTKAAGRYAGISYAEIMIQFGRPSEKE